MKSTSDEPIGVDESDAWMTEPLAATVHLAFAFDIGDEIDLDQARLILQGEPGQLPRRRRTPESIGYRPAPIRVELEPAGIALPGEWAWDRPPRGELTLLDFGAISLAVRFPVSATPTALLELAGRLAEPAPLTEAARRLLTPWLERIQPSVYDFAVSEMSEEYIVFQLPKRAGGWLDDRADWIAGLVRLESEPLSPGEVREATRLSLSYTPNDLVVLDWAAGVVSDSECADTLQVIEFANVQLLEFRHIDDRLDDRLEAAYRLIRPERRKPVGTRALAPPRRCRAADPRARDRGDQPLRAGRQCTQTDRRSLPVPRLRSRLGAVPPPRLAAEYPSQARDRGPRL